MIRLYGVDFWASWGLEEPALTKYDIIGQLAEYGANVIRIHLYAQNYLTSDARGDYYARAVRAACIRGKQLGVKVILSSHAYDDNSFTSLGRVITDDTKQTEWINAFIQVILDCNPDGIEIMNEPPDATLGQNPDISFAKYRAFVVRAIEAYRAINPDLIFFVDGCPFWNPGIWVTNPLPYQNTSYVLHLHYFDGEPNPSWPEYKWFHAYMTGDLTTAKAELENYILHVEGISGLLNSGLTVTFTECGSSLDMPNFNAELRDLHDIALKYGIGFMQSFFQSITSDPMGMLNSDWRTLNAMGQLWLEVMPSPVIYSLIISSSIGGTTNPATGRYDYNEGTPAVVTAIPDAGYRFSHWELDGTTKTENPVSFTMNMDYSLRAVFEELPPPLPEKRYLTIVAINGQTTPDQGTYEADIDSIITVTATANSGYKFKEWLLDNVQAGIQPFITITMDTNHTLVAFFEVIPTPPPPTPPWKVAVAILAGLAGVGVIVTQT